MPKMALIRNMEDYRVLCAQAKNDPVTFWGSLAREEIDWFKPYDVVLNSSDAPHYKWFEGGQLNIAHQCIERHLKSRGDKTALIWESEDGKAKSVTYNSLSKHVNRFANLLKDLNVTKGDRVVLYMPMILEATYAMLACAKIGAVHVVVFGGFSAESLRERIIDTGAKLVITADGAHRNGKSYLLKPTVDKALYGIESPPSVLVVEHNHEKVSYKPERDFKYNKLIVEQPDTCETLPMESEDMLFILHTSGSTGKPKGIKHTTAGYILWAQYTSELALDIKPDDVFWCTADIGWITGHTYSVYGPLSIGATTLIYEGTPLYPDCGRWWKIIEKHKVTQFYTAPTAIRMLKKDGPNVPESYNLDSLRVLGSVGEPINPEAWHWYYKAIGQEKCPIIDTWWQTETGGHMIAPIPVVTILKPGSATLPLPGISAEIVRIDGRKVEPGEKGFLCITQPWPSMLRGIWNDDDRYQEAYYSKIKQNKGPIFFSGDCAMYDENGYIIITGRADDVINVSGHRVGATEIESVLAGHSSIAEVAIVSLPDEIKGEGIFAFIVLRNDTYDIDRDKLHGELNAILREAIGPIIKLDDLLLTPGLPKTRSGKVLRRILKTLARREPVTQDVSTLDNPQLIEIIQILINNE